MWGLSQQSQHQKAPSSDASSKMILHVSIGCGLAFAHAANQDVSSTPHCPQAEADSEPQGVYFPGKAITFALVRYTAFSCPNTDCHVQRGQGPGQSQETQRQGLCTLLLHLNNVLAVVVLRQSLEQLAWSCRSAPPLLKTLRPGSVGMCQQSTLECFP